MAQCPLLELFGEGNTPAYCQFHLQALLYLSLILNFQSFASTNQVKLYITRELFDLEAISFEEEVMKGLAGRIYCALRNAEGAHEHKYTEKQERESQMDLADKTWACICK